MLVATNPQHFGRLGELNTAEALGAALYLLGRPAQARGLLDGFAGGRALFEVNQERLERYASRATPEEVLAAEQALFAPS
jgi:ribosome biogenesis protein Tsr3